MMTESYRTGPEARLHQGNLLSPAVRREIAGLNRLFLERAIRLRQAGDPWFGVPRGASDCLAAAPLDAWERAAACPVALFELRLPDPAAGIASFDGVGEDAGAPGDALVAETRRAFGITALGVARSLCDVVPLATRIAFGIDPRLEAQLCAMTLSDSYRLAAWSGLIRPRWSGHERFWSLFAGAVTRGESVHWAYTAGLCLLGQCERQPTTVVYSARARARPAHRRPDVPC
jgi:hypothetical protein